jgi:putative tryptophan/tyrosine transport system substrate-binding protein
MIRRREFITLLSGATAWPLAASAQTGSMRRIGVLMNLAADDPESTARLATFLQALQARGWTDGRNVHIDVRWGAADDDRMRKYAMELVALMPDVILAAAGSTVAPLLQATRTVPIVFAQTADPVGVGYVASLARPGGNATGFSQFEYSTKRQMAGAAQGVCAAPLARRSASGSNRVAAVRRDSDRGVVIRG